MLVEVRGRDPHERVAHKRELEHAAPRHQPARLLLGELLGKVPQAAVLVAVGQEVVLGVGQIEHEAEPHPPRGGGHFGEPTVRQAERLCKDGIGEGRRRAIRQVEHEQAGGNFRGGTMHQETPLGKKTLQGRHRAYVVHI